MRKRIIFSMLVLMVLCLTMVIPVSATPDIESCDGAGNPKDTFNPGEPVYLYGSGLEPNSGYYVYIVLDHEPWVRGTTNLEELTVKVGPIEVETDEFGYFVGQPLLIWESAGPGAYDIWADCTTAGVADVYDAFDDIDNLDVDTAGFFVIPQAPMGIFAMLFAFFIAGLIKRKSFCNLRKA